MAKPTPKRSRRKPQPVAPSPQIEGLTWIDQITPKPMDWLVPGIILGRAVSLIEGRKGTGKSTVLAAIAAAITGAAALPGYQCPNPRPVIWDAGEDDWESVVLPRLSAAGADLTRVGRLSPLTRSGERGRLLLPRDTARLRSIVERSGAVLLILDPYASAVEPGIDLRVEQSARYYLDCVAEATCAVGCAVLLSRHIRKGCAGDVREAGLGSVGVSNYARGILRSDEHPRERDLYCLSTVATNAARRAPTLTYRIVDDGLGYPRIQWVGTAPLDADEIAEGRQDVATRDETTDAERVLSGCIGSDWRPAKVVMAEASAAGIPERTLRRAKATLRVPSRRVLLGSDCHWEWGPPLGGWPDGLV